MQGMAGPRVQTLALQHACPLAALRSVSPSPARQGFLQQGSPEALRQGGRRSQTHEHPELVRKTENDKKPMTSKEQRGSRGSKRNKELGPKQRPCVPTACLAGQGLASSAP